MLFLTGILSWITGTCIVSQSVQFLYRFNFTVSILLSCMKFFEKQGIGKFPWHAIKFTIKIRSVICKHYKELIKNESQAENLDRLFEKEKIMIG